MISSLGTSLCETFETLDALELSFLELFFAEILMLLLELFFEFLELELFLFKGYKNIASLKTSFYEPYFLYENFLVGALAGPFALR